MLHFMRISYIFDKTRENMREIENDGRMKINLKNILHTVIHFIYIFFYNNSFFPEHQFAPISNYLRLSLVIILHEYSLVKKKREKRWKLSTQWFTARTFTNNLRVRQKVCFFAEISDILRPSTMARKIHSRLPRKFACYVRKRRWSVIKG